MKYTIDENLISDLNLYFYSFLTKRGKITLPTNITHLEDIFKEMIRSMSINYCIENAYRYNTNRLKSDVKGYFITILTSFLLKEINKINNDEEYQKKIFNELISKDRNHKINKLLIT